MQQEECSIGAAATPTMPEVEEIFSGVSETDIDAMYGPESQERSIVHRDAAAGVDGPEAGWCRTNGAGAI